MEAKVPKEILRNNRPVDPVFLPNEELYYRFNQVDGERVSPLAIKYPDTSVNRGKYDEPQWVLLHEHPRFQHWGYGAFEVRDVPKALTSEGGVTHNFVVKHDPLEKNYPHSEIRAYRDGDNARIRKKNKSILGKFQVQLSRRIRILKFPDI